MIGAIIDDVLGSTFERHATKSTNFPSSRPAAASRTTPC